MTQIISQLGSSDPGSSFGSNTLPSFDSVAGEWWFGGDASKNVNAMTGVLATSEGSPVYAPGFINLGDSPNDYLTLDVGPTASDFSIVALVRPNASIAKAIIAGNITDAANYNLVFGNANNISAGNGQITGSTDQSVLPLPDPAKFVLVMGVYRIGLPSRIYLISESGTSTDDGAAQFVPTTRLMTPMRIGGFYNVNWGGRFDVAGFAIIAEAKPQSYIETLYPMWKTYAEARGLSVA